MRGMEDLEVQDILLKKEQPRQISGQGGLDIRQTVQHLLWTRDQMMRCEPFPTVGLRKALRKRFAVTDVDEFRTSKTCNKCMGELTSYKKGEGKIHTLDCVAHTADVTKTVRSGVSTGT